MERRVTLLGHSPIRILKESRVTWTFSYTYFEGKQSNTYRRNVQVTLLSFKIRIGECPSNSPFLQNTYDRKESYLDILLYVFSTKWELLGHSPIRILKERRVTWTFSYTYFEGKQSYLDMNVQVTLLSFEIRLGECPSNSPVLQNTYKYVFWRKGKLLGHSTIRILNERRVTFTFSYAYLEREESYLDILLCVFLSFKIRIGECPSNSPFLQNTHRRMSQ
jgi:hypothetical protein